MSSCSFNTTALSQLKLKSIWFTLSSYAIDLDKDLYADEWYLVVTLPPVDRSFKLLNTSSFSCLVGRYISDYSPWPTREAALSFVTAERRESDRTLSDSIRFVYYKDVVGAWCYYSGEFYPKTFIFDLKTLPADLLEVILNHSEWEEARRHEIDVVTGKIKTPPGEVFALLIFFLFCPFAAIYCFITFFQYLMGH